MLLDGEDQWKQRKQESLQVFNAQRKIWNLNNIKIQSSFLEILAFDLATRIFYGEKVRNSN